MAGGITLQQAAEILGVPENASKKEVNDAYRKLIGKYHPDAHRNEPPEAQAEAEKMFKAVNRAKKVMMNPRLAAQPEQPQQQRQPEQPQQRPGRTQQPPRRQQPQQSPEPGLRQRPQPPSPDDYEPYEPSDFHTSIPQNVRYNAPTNTTFRGAPPKGRTSRRAYDDEMDFGDVPMSPGHTGTTAFDDGIERVPDPAEAQIARIYANEARDMYASSSDKFRITPSFAVSLAFIAIMAASMMTGGALQPAARAAAVHALPYIVLIVAALLKMGVYDLLAAYPVKRALARKFGLGWLFECGCEAVIMAVVFQVVLFVMAQTISPLLIIAALTGIGLMIAGVVSKMSKDL